jgi:hypothetical protein
MDSTISTATTGVTANAIDLRTLPDFVPSLCIPRVYPNINQGRIRKIINDLNLGIIERIDIVSKTTEKGEKYNRVFIHMECWFQNSNASFARERLLGGKDIKIIYDDPWFWKISAYKPGGEGSNNRKQNLPNVRSSNNNNNIIDLPRKR